MFTLFLLIVEPIGVIAVFGTVSNFLLRMPVYGPSTVLFHATGILPYYYYIRICARGRSFDRKTERDNRLPCIEPIDEYLTLVILEFIVMSVASVITLVGVAVFINPMAVPFNPWACIWALLLVTLWACGVNLVNVAIIHVTEIWASLMIIFNRGMILLSGVFFVMDFVPPRIRYWLNWNPLSHAIIWFRTGIFTHYPVYSLDRNYLVLTAFFSLVFGVILERAMRNFESTR